MADPMWKKKGSPVVNHFTNPRFVGASADLGDLLTGGQMILWDAMPDPAGVAVVSPGGALVSLAGREVRIPRGGSVADNDPDFEVDGAELVGIRVIGVEGVGCLAVHSARFGGSLRVIPTAATTDTYVRFAVPVSGAGTVLVTSHLLGPLSGELHPSSRCVLVGGETTSPPPNATGTTEARLSFAAGDDVQLMHGGVAGSGDMYWTLGGVYEGVYTGEPFSGATPDTGEIVHDWVGTPDASPSRRQEMEAIMATIYGTLSDFGLASLAPYRPVLKFVPSGPGAKGKRLFSGRPVEVKVGSGGAFSVLLESTDGVRPKVWYTVTIEYLNEGGQFTSLDVLGYRLFVPGVGGAIGDLPDGPLSGDSVLVSLAPPPPGYKGWYLNAAGAGNPPGDPDDPSSSGTGILEIVS